MCMVYSSHAGVQWATTNSKQETEIAHTHARTKQRRQSKNNNRNTRTSALVPLYAKEKKCEKEIHAVAWQMKESKQAETKG